MTMRWQRGRMDNNDAMAIGGQQHAERSRAPRHPSETAINLCRQFGEELTRERDNFGGGDDRKGSRWRRLSGDHFISTQSIPNLPSGPQYIERTGTYSACVLGVRLRYRRHGDHVY
jgi:hypothetical protein